MAFNRFINLILLILISGQTFSQEEIQHARDGYSHTINGFFPEIRLNSCADISAGAGLSYKFERISKEFILQR